MLDRLPFDNCVAASGGSSLVYAYNRVTTPSSAAFRALNTEYTASEAAVTQYNVNLATFGGTYAIDEVIAKASNGAPIDQVQFQAEQKIKAAAALFQDAAINGDVGQDANSFDGLDKALTGSSTEFIPDTAIDLSTSAAIDTNYKTFLDVLDEFLMGLDGTPAGLFGNIKGIAKLRAVARRAGMYQTAKTDFGTQVEQYGNIPFVDLGNKPGTNTPIVPIDADDNTTSIYAVRFGLDGFHAVSLTGSNGFDVVLPDFGKGAECVKHGKVTMTATVALKATKAAGVFRNIKV